MDAKKTVLIIQYDFDIRTIYSELLKEAGFGVVESNNSEDGRDLLHKTEWDILLIDWESEIDGERILREMRASERLRSKPFVLFSKGGSYRAIDLEFDPEPSGYLDGLNSNPNDVVDLVNKILSNKSDWRDSF